MFNRESSTGAVLVWLRAGYLPIKGKFMPQFATDGYRTLVLPPILFAHASLLV